MPRAARLRTTLDTVAQRRAAVRAERKRQTDDPWWASRQSPPEEDHSPVRQPPAAETTPAAEATAGAEATGEIPATDAAERAVPDAAPRPPEEPRYGVPGMPVSRAHPFYIGFMGAVGVLVAWFLLGLLGKLDSVLTLVVIAIFLALALDPPVRALQGRGMRRGPAVAVVFTGLLALFTAFALSVVPPLVSEATDLSTTLPTWVERFQNSALVVRLDQQFGIINTFTDQLQARLSSGETVLQLFGGVLGAGQAVISGAFSLFTVVVLTLYFTASLNTLREAVYSLVPSSRRPRVRLLGDEIISRVGGYTAGQVTVATINGMFTYVGLLVLGLPFALVLAITVAILGLIPMIGATLGAGVITIAALFHSWQYAVIVIIYYLIYQQIENYLIAPRIMARTVKVPGFLAVIAALAGAALLGVLGALIAIPIAAGILLIVQEVVIPRQQRH